MNEKAYAAIVSAIVTAITSGGIAWKATSTSVQDSCNGQIIEIAHNVSEELVRCKEERNAE